MPSRPPTCAARAAVQGRGNVGWHLCEYLIRVGADLVSEGSFQKVERAVAEFGAEPAMTEEIYSADADVLAP